MAEAEAQVQMTPAPSRSGIVDRGIGWLERRPGTAIPWIIVGVLVLALLAHAASWLAGETPVGTLRQALFLPVAFLGFFLLLIVVLDAVAYTAFDDFRVALDQPAETIERLRADLTSIPDVPAVLATVVWTLVATSTGQDPAETAEPRVTWLALGILWSLTNAAFALLIVHTLRQLRQVGRLQAIVARVNLLDPAPINAFSRLTAATAGGIVTIGVLFAVVDANEPSAIGFAVELVIAAIAIAFFVLPLRGMHGRLAAEKGRLLGDANTRLLLVVDRIHRMVDADDLTRADQLQKTEQALLAERDLYLHLSTWPWSTGTFRGLLSAVMLPIFIGVVLRLATRYI